MLFRSTLLAAKAYDSTLQADIQRIFTVGVLETANNESLKIAENLKEKTRGVELVIDNYNSKEDFDIINELRIRLDNAGYKFVEIYISGDSINPDSIAVLKDENYPIQGIIVEKYIGLAQSLPFRSEIKQIEGKQVGRNGQIPGIIDNPKLNKLI